MLGITSTMIAKELNEADVLCPACKSRLGEDEIEAEKADRKKARWSASTVESILTDEKYKGDAILQKTYCTDYILITFVANDGSEISEYYAQNSHPAIVSSEVFDLAQMELEWRKSLNGSYSGKTSLHPELCVETAALSMAERSGTARMHTGVLYGAVMENT